ncbi:hypothetical protein Tco_1464556, partial [Tanacetum coccineum]
LSRPSSSSRRTLLDLKSRTESKAQPLPRRQHNLMNIRSTSTSSIGWSKRVDEVVGNGVNVGGMNSGEGIWGSGDDNRVSGDSGGVMAVYSQTHQSQTALSPQRRGQG